MSAAPVSGIARPAAARSFWGLGVRGRRLHRGYTATSFAPGWQAVWQAAVWQAGGQV